MGQDFDKQQLNKLGFCLCVFTASYALFFFIPDSLFLHMDLGWHLATGKLIRELGALPASEPWSTNSQPGKWQNIYWLWQVLSSYTVEKTGDLSLLFVASAMMGALVNCIVVWHAFSLGVGYLAATTIAFFFGLSWLFIGTLDPSVTVSPKTCSALGFALLHFLIVKYIHAGNLSLLIAGSILLGVWGNLHGLALPGELMLAVYVISLLSQRRIKPALALSCCAMFGCLLVLLSNPAAPKLFNMLLDSSDDPAKVNISEWQQFSLGFSPLATAYLASFAVLLALGYKHIPRGEKFQCIFWFLMGLSAVRHLQFFMIVSAPTVGFLFDSLIFKKSERWRYFENLIESCPALTKVRILSVVSIAVLVYLPFRCFHTSSTGLDFPTSLYPQASLRYIEENLSNRKMLNDWNFGGYIIFKSSGKLKVWIDGRSGTVYPDKVLLDWTRLQLETKEVLEEYQPEVVFIGNKRPANAYLENSQDWKKVFADPVSNVFVRAVN